jgi:hypothetical protein
MDEQTCCTNADIRKCLIWFWPFIGEMCANCNALRFTCHPWLERLWNLFLSPLWDGRVRVWDDDLC